MHSTEIQCQRTIITIIIIHHQWTFSTVGHMSLLRKEVAASYTNFTVLLIHHEHGSNIQIMWRFSNSFFMGLWADEQTHRLIITTPEVPQVRCLPLGIGYGGGVGVWDSSITHSMKHSASSVSHHTLWDETLFLYKK